MSARLPNLDEVLRLDLPGFAIEKRLGAGGMGVVFLARELATGGKVALKVLPPSYARDPAHLRRFEREAAALTRLHHPNIIAAPRCLHSGEFLVIVMPYMPLGSLRGLLDRKGPLEEATAARLCAQAARGLWAAARAGIVHRDIKPDNLLLGEREHIVISDFGLVKLTARSSFTDEGSALGTAAYMPPEQWDDCRKADHRSDLYALGCTLFELLSGRKPFMGNSLELMKQHMIDSPPSLDQLRPALSRRIVEIVARLLAKDPDARFQSGERLAAELADLCGHQSSSEATVLEPNLLAFVGDASVPAWVVWLPLLGVGLLLLVAVVLLAIAWL